MKTGTTPNSPTLIRSAKQEKPKTNTQETLIEGRKNITQTNYNIPTQKQQQDSKDYHFEHGNAAGHTESLTQSLKKLNPVEHIFMTNHTCTKL